MNVSPTLLILAAGMGSRYGGLKQLDAMGPNGETVLDYSVYDAIRAGFTQVVFVIRKDFEQDFRRSIGARFDGRIQVTYAYQELDDLPEGMQPPIGREKPWGTTHAVRAARDLIKTPFAVINADDFYGQDAFIQLSRYFETKQEASGLSTCMVAYPLSNTLSENGSVNRGICKVDSGNCLESVEEHTEIATAADQAVSGKNLSGTPVEIAREAPVSMNFWGFTPEIFDCIEIQFKEFLEAQGSELKSECYIPTVVDRLIQTKQTKCRVLQTSAEWFGVTYPGDKPYVQKSIQRLVEEGRYPSPL